MKRILITGITGFAGSYLAEYLVSKKDYNVFGTYLFEDSLRNVESVKSKIDTIKIDLNLSEKVFDLIKKIKPDLVFHLAALTSPADSFKNPVGAITNNIAAEINVLTGVKDNNLYSTKVLVISSADIYGLVKKEDLPIDEETRLLPTSPYSISKIAQDFLGLQYFLSYNLKIVRVRPFNHIGPRQSPHFVVSSIAKKIAEIEKGKKEPTLPVGNLEAKRDFTDVRDMVRAYVIALEKGKLGDVYNIGSGVSYKIKDILKKLLSFSSSKITVRRDKALFRPIDNPNLVCNASKFVRISNWRPEIMIDITLKDTLDYWRRIV